MKKAYMIFAYYDAEKCRRLVNALDENCDFFIHVDAKADIMPFKALLTRGNVHFTESRVKVYWAGWSQVQAIMLMLEAALHHSKDYSHIILITETDYPIKSNKAIERYLADHVDTEFVMALDAVAHEPAKKYNRAWWYDFPIASFFFRKWVTRIANNLVLPLWRKREYCYLRGTPVHPFLGQMLFAVTPKCAEYILDVYHRDKRYNRYMKTVFAPCEFYYQTIVFNSEFRSKTCQNGMEHECTPDFSWAPLHKYDYKEKIKVYSEQDFDELIESDALFFRKAIRGTSDRLMDRIDRLRQNV